MKRLMSMNIFRSTLLAAVAAAVLALAPPGMLGSARAQNGPANVTVKIIWQTNTDVDLHVFEPNDQHCFYGNKRTSNGGSLDHDSQSAGHEQYSMTNGPSGPYRVEVQMFRDNGVSETPVTVQVWENGQLTRNETHTLRNNGSTVRFYYSY